MNERIVAALRCLSVASRAVITSFISAAVAAMVAWNVIASEAIFISWLNVSVPGHTGIALLGITSIVMSWIAAANIWHAASLLWAAEFKDGVSIASIRIALSGTTFLSGSPALHYGATFLTQACLLAVLIKVADQMSVLADIMFFLVWLVAAPLAARARYDLSQASLIQSELFWRLIPGAAVPAATAWFVRGFGRLLRKEGFFAVAWWSLRNTQRLQRAAAENWKEYVEQSADEIENTPLGPELIAWITSTLQNAKVPAADSSSEAVTLNPPAV